MNIGIIGGADGPTTVFISSSVDWVLVIGAAVVVIGGITAVLLIRKRRKKDRR